MIGIPEEHPIFPLPSSLEGLGGTNSAASSWMSVKRVSLQDT